MTVRKRTRMMTMRNRRNFIFCKCAVTEEILKEKFEKNHKKKHFKKPNNIIKEGIILK